MKKALLLLVVFTCIISKSEAQWQQLNGLDSMWVRALAVSGNNIFAGTEPDGLFFSNDDGNTWTLLNNGIPATTVWALGVCGTSVFASVGPLYRSMNNGSSWSKVTIGSSSPSVMSVAVDGTTIIVGCLGGVYLSRDNGNSWTPRNSGLPGQILSVAVKGAVIYAGTSHQGLYKSIDTGYTWTPAINGFPTTADVLSLVISDSIVYAGLGCSGQAIFYSSDTGNSWTKANIGMYVYINALALCMNTIFAGTAYGGGVTLSANNGSIWTWVNNGLPVTDIYSIAISVTDAYVGTHYNGVWKSGYPCGEMGVEEIKKNNSFTISPNPLTSTSTLKLNGIVGNVEVTVTDMLGKELLKKQMTGNSMEINKGGITSGIYIVRVTSDGKQYIQKLVVQ